MIKRSPSQIYFEQLFTGSNGVPFQNIPNKTYKNTQLSLEIANDFSSLIKTEMLSYYYKSILSFSESIKAVQTKNYSWATVKLYYSVFYSLRTMLLSKNIVFLRAGMDRKKLLYVKAEENEYYKDSPDSTDHKSTLAVFQKYCKGDWLLTQNIFDYSGSSITTYEWLAKRREDVNYKDIEFKDPEPFDSWLYMDGLITNLGFNKFFNILLNDVYDLCFQDEYAVLAIPTLRIILTSKEVLYAGLFLDEEKISFIRSHLENLDESFVNAILLLQD